MSEIMTVDYETEVGGWTEERVKAFVDGAFQAMENAIRGGMDARLRYDGITSPLASQLFRVYGENGSPISDGIVTRAALYSLAIMEYSNASGVAGALVAADLALAGIASPLPPDEVIDAMKAVGEQLPPALRETGEGGCAACPSAGCMEKESTGCAGRGG